MEIKIPAHYPPEIISQLQRRLSPGRLAHTVSTTEYLCAIAREIGLDEFQALQAGLLHDFCREDTDEVLLAKAAQYQIPVNETASACPALLHGPVAAEECRRTLGVADPDIYEAIYWHTFGKPGLEKLGQALYLADFAEHSRTHAEAAHTRAVLETAGFEAAVRYAAEKNVEHLARKKYCDPHTLAFYHWLQEKDGV